MDAGLMLARLISGLVMAAHGSQKLFGWFGGYGLSGTGSLFESLGFHPGRLFAAGTAETAGGLLLALGFAQPIGAALILATMLVAAITVHWPHGLFATNNGIEVPLLYAAGAVSLALIGPGTYSTDSALGLATFWTPAFTVGILALGVIGGVANVALRRPSPATAAA